MMSLKKSEKGAEAAGEVVNEEEIPIWASLGKISGDDTRGRMPRRLSCRLHTPRDLEVIPEHGHVDRRGEKGELRPSRHELALRLLRRPGIFGHSLAFGGLGRHGGCEKQEGIG